MSLTAFAEAYSQFSSNEQAQFADTLRRLLSDGLLWREDENDRRSYLFLLRYHELVSDYLAVSGWLLHHDERLNLFHLTHQDGAHRKRLARDTTLWLLLLRLLYAEKQEHLQLTRYPVVTIGEISQRYAEFFPGERVRKKSSREDALRTLAHLKLLRPANGTTLRLNDLEQPLELLPSFEIVVPANEIAAIAERLHTYQRDTAATGEDAAGDSEAGDE
jgi:hypothetical protein